MVGGQGGEGGGLVDADGGDEGGEGGDGFAVGRPFRRWWLPGPSTADLERRLIEVEARLSRLELEDGG